MKTLTLHARCNNRREKNNANSWHPSLVLIGGESSLIQAVMSRQDTSTKTDSHPTKTRASFMFASMPECHWEKKSEPKWLVPIQLSESQKIHIWEPPEKRCCFYGNSFLTFLENSQIISPWEETRHLHPIFFTSCKIWVWLLQNRPPSPLETLH